VLKGRAEGFVTGKITQGFTPRYACPPGLTFNRFCRHLTHGL
jgi:hypothetical protein